MALSLTTSNSVVQSAQLTNIRTAINNLRTKHQLSNYTFASMNSNPVSAAEMNSVIAGYNTLGTISALGAVANAGGNVTANSTLIQASRLATMETWLNSKETVPCAHNSPVNTSSYYGGSNYATCNSHDSSYDSCPANNSPVQSSVQSSYNGGSYTPGK